MIYAGFCRRAAAFILDMIIVSIPTTLIFGPMVAVGTLALGNTSEDISAMQAGLVGATLVSWQLVALVVTWLYFAFFESGKKQSTWGKRLLGIKVIDSNGGRISFARATGRFFSKFISYITFYIGFIMAGFTNQKRALHDMIAETYVVKQDFEEGQQLPKTPSHTLSLVIISIIWVLFLIGISVLSARLSQTPTQQAASRAASYVEELARKGTGLNAPLRTEGATFFYTADGYRAVVTDPVSNNKFTLFLQNGTNETCCLAFPFGDCADTGITECK